MNDFCLSARAFGITQLYQNLLSLMTDHGEKIDSHAGKTLELMNVVSVLEYPRYRLILDPHRKHSLKYLKEEFKWYMSQDASIKEISRHASMWKHVSDDGITVNSNYGLKVFCKDYQGTSQYDMVKRELQRDPSSRRAVWFYLLGHDYKQMHKTKDFPCSLHSQFMIRDDALHQTVHMRSCDLIYGWCNDVPFFNLLQEMLAKDLGLDIGPLTHIAGSLHVYEKHFHLLLNRTTPCAGSELDELAFPMMTQKTVRCLKDPMNEIEDFDDAFLNFLYEEGNENNENND